MTPSLARSTGSDKLTKVNAAVYTNYQVQTAAFKFNAESLPDYNNPKSVIFYISRLSDK